MFNSRNPQLFIENLEPPPEDEGFGTNSVVIAATGGWASRDIRLINATNSIAALNSWTPKSRNEKTNHQLSLYRLGSNLGFIQFGSNEDSSWTLGEIRVEYPEPAHLYTEEEALQYLRMNEALRGQGHGTYLLNTFVELASKFGVAEINANVSIHMGAEFWERIHLDEWESEVNPDIYETQSGISRSRLYEYECANQLLTDYILDRALEVNPLSIENEIQRKFFVENIKRIKFYRQHGFEIVGVEYMTPGENPPFLNDVIMKLDIAQYSTNQAEI